MKFVIEVDDKLDLSTFHSMFISLLGKEHSTYDIRVNKEVTVQVITFLDPKIEEGIAQMGLLEPPKALDTHLPLHAISSSGSQVSQQFTQINPCRDIRFRELSFIQENFCGADWCRMVCTEPQKVFDRINQLVKIVHKVQNLKAFL